MTHEGKTGVASEQSTIDFAELSLAERAKLATLSVSYGVGAAAITRADHTEPTCYIQYTLDAGLNPLFPVPQTEKKSSQPDNSSVAERHPADMEEQEI